MTTFQKQLIQRLAAKKRSKKNGFTLVEMMVVVAILGVLMAVALPQLTKAQDRAKSSAAQQALVNTAKTCSIDLLGGEDAYVVGSDDDEVVGTCDYEEDLVAAAGGKTHTITIDSNGIPSSPDTTDTVTTP